MSKVDILRLDSVTTNDTKATTTINTNFQNIQSVIETLLSRTGVTPNYMDAVLDMNSYRIINTAAPTEDFDVVNLKYLRDYVGNLETLVSQATEAAQVATAQAQNAASSSNIAASAVQTALEARDGTINTYLQVQEIKTDIEGIAEDIEDIAEDPNIVAVGEDLRSPTSNIKNVNNNMNSITTAVNNIEAIIEAPTAAIQAQNYSDLSQDWAIKTDGPVSEGEYSAKYWAQQASLGTVVDNKSINRNSNDELQTIGVIDQNNTSTALKEWSGTTQEYTAIQTKDANTIYNVLEDGVYKGSTKIAAYVSSGGYHPDLLSFQWSDHLFNNVSWLRADTFSWQDGTVYEAAYEHLSNDITGITPTTETIGSNTITVYTATDGHKIVLADQAQTVQDIYDETGVAWYFILDTTNQRFKLPRTKFGLTGLRDTVGKYVEAGLPNITGAFNVSAEEQNYISGAFYENGTFRGNGANAEPNKHINFDASRSSSVYGNSDTVQPPATQMYLYFYVGDYTQTAIEQTAGLNAELFNSKADISAVWTPETSTQQQKETIVGWSMPDYDSGYTVMATVIGTYYWVKATTDGKVFVNDPNNQDYYIRLSKTGSVNGTGESTAPESTLPSDQFLIIYHNDAFNGTGKGGAFAFIPKGYYFSLEGFAGTTGIFYPLKGVL